MPKKVYIICTSLKKHFMRVNLKVLLSFSFSCEFSISCLHSAFFIQAGLFGEEPR